MPRHLTKSRKGAIEEAEMLRPPITVAKCPGGCESGVHRNDQRRTWVMWHAKFGGERLEEELPDLTITESFESVGAMYLAWLGQFHVV